MTIHSVADVLQTFAVIVLVATLLTGCCHDNAGPAGTTEPSDSGSSAPVNESHEP